MTTINDLVGTWKVTSAQQLANVSVEQSSSNPSRIKFHLNGSCELIGSIFVTNPNSQILPVRWAASSFSQGALGVHGIVDSAGSSPTSHDVLINVANGILTCEIDPDDSPGSQWTGTHP